MAIHHSQVDLSIKRANGFEERESENKTSRRIELAHTANQKESGSEQKERLKVKKKVVREER